MRNDRTDRTDRTGRAMAAQGAGPIDKEQTSALILAARRAWQAQTAAGLEDGAFEAWRHAALWDAVRKQSFRAVTQGEYARAMAYFGRLSGGSGAPPREAASGAADELRRAVWRLREECRDAGDAFGGEEAAQRYAATLLKNIHKATLETATARQIWQVAFTLRNRAQKKRAAAPEAPAAKPPETAQGGAGAREAVSGRAAAAERFPAFSRVFAAVREREA